MLDKHGTLAREIANSRSCIFWRPADLRFPIGLNPLNNVHPDLRWKVTADVVSIFSDVWKLGPETPRLLYYLRAAVRLLLDTPASSLIDIRRVLSEAPFRARLLHKCNDRETRRTFLELEAKKPEQQAMEIGSLLNKVAALADPLPLRYTLGQSTTLHIDKILERGTPLVVDLSGLGDEPASLLGALIINSFKQAAEAASDPQEYDLFIDEFAAFGSSAIASILSEARKWKLNLTVAHQFLTQLSVEVRDAVWGNCSTLISFRVGAEDAPIVARAIGTHPQTLTDLSVGHAYYNTIVNGETTGAKPWHVEPVSLPGGFLEGNKNWTAANFARPRALVEKKLSGIERFEWRRDT